MAKYKLNFLLQAWITNLEIEASNEEEALNTLYKMDMDEIINKGYVKEIETSDEDLELVAAGYEILVEVEEWGSDYLDMDDEEAVAKFEKLPRQFTINLDEVYETDLLETAIEDEIESNYFYIPENYTYKIIKKY
jgi:hypothetical protein